MQDKKWILAIDTSCDDTAVAVTCGRKIFSNVLDSQIEIHKKYGGVYPTEAKRAHKEKIDIVVQQALNSAIHTVRTQTKETLDKHSLWKKLDAIAVTQGPGLAPSLEVGIDTAKKLAQEHQKPLLAVNHMEGHLLSPLAQNSVGKGSFDIDIYRQSNYPILSLLVSGRNTELVIITQPPNSKQSGRYEIIGETQDDAVGEAYDKVARMLKLGYPGGEIIELLAKEGNPNAYDFPLPMSKHPGFDFSFSGLKTAVMYSLKRQQHGDSNKQVQLGELPELDKKTICDYAASFQSTAINTLCLKLNRAIKKYQPKSIWIGGGVSSNLELRRQIRKRIKLYNLKLYAPYTQKLCTDNAAMIGVAAYFQSLRDDYWHDLDALEREPNLNF